MTLIDTLGKTLGNASFISKGWGYEKILCNNDQYCGKLLHFVAGRRCSVHYHMEKTGTFYLHKGKMDVFYFDGPDLLKAHTDKLYDFMEKVTLTQGMVFEVPIGRVHQMVALEDSELFEFSTQDFSEDSYRILKGD